MELYAIYKPGELHLQTTVTENGLCAYSGIHRESGKDFTVDEYLEHMGKEFVCIPLDEAIEQIMAEEETAYIKPWKEITEEQWDYALNVLPPQKWQTVRGVNIFRMCEYMTSNITAHYATCCNKYYMAYRRTSSDYNKLAQEVWDKWVEKTICRR